MVLTRTKSTRYNTKCSYGEIINKFQDCNIKKPTKTLERKKKKKTPKQGFDFI